MKPQLLLSHTLSPPLSNLHFRTNRSLPRATTLTFLTRNSRRFDFLRVPPQNPNSMVLLILNLLHFLVHTSQFSQSNVFFFRLLKRWDSTDRWLKSGNRRKSWTEIWCWRRALRVHCLRRWHLSRVSRVSKRLLRSWNWTLLLLRVEFSGFR